MSLSLQTTQAKSIPLASEIDATGHQWAMLVPAGRIETKDSRGPYFLKDAEAVITASFEASNTGSLPVDVNHSIDLQQPLGKPTPASGWIIEMQARSDGIWGLIEWTANAVVSIRNREYRFLSPVVAHTLDKEIKAIARASLTNNPNFTMTALNAAQEDNSMDSEQFLKDLRMALNLADNADGAAILAAVKSIGESRNSADPAKFVPIGTFQQTVAELNKLRSGVSLQAAEDFVKHAVQTGKILPFMKDWAVNLCQANKAAFDDFLDGAGKPITEFITSATTMSDLNARGAGQSLQVSEVNQMLGHSTEDLKKYGEGLAR